MVGLPVELRTNQRRELSNLNEQLAGSVYRESQNTYLVFIAALRTEAQWLVGVVAVMMLMVMPMMMLTMMLMMMLTMMLMMMLMMDDDKMSILKPAVVLYWCMRHSFSTIFPWLPDVTASLNRSWTSRALSPRRRTGLGPVGLFRLAAVAPAVLMDCREAMLVLACR
jgi:hypothetical protein